MDEFDARVSDRANQERRLDAASNFDRESHARRWSRFVVAYGAARDRSAQGPLQILAEAARLARWQRR